MRYEQRKRVWEPGTVVQHQVSPDGTAQPCRVQRLESFTREGMARDRILISTQQNDPADGLDELVATGGEVESYLQGNPVVGYNHGHGRISTPIGRTTELVIRAGFGIEAAWEWPPWDMDEDADKIHRLWDGRFIHAASIWYTIVSARVKDGHEKEWWPPLIIDKWKMREWALVYVPADSQAHRQRDRELLRMVMPRSDRRKLEQRARRRVNPDGTVAAEARSVQAIVPLEMTTLAMRLAELQGMTRSFLKSL